jgi:transmembrane sensor
MATEIPDKLLNQAIRALTRRHSGAWTQEDERQLATWLAASTAHREAYERVTQFWESTGQLQGSDFPQLANRMPRVQRMVWAVAAVLLAAVAVPVCLQLSRWWNGVPVHWSAPQGESRSVVLEDGTHVLLDADSDLVAKLGAHARRVSLVRGEALFTVTHDASRPFEIELGPGRIVDLGTRFDVEKLPSAVRVAVFEGRVGLRTVHGEMVLGAGRGSGFDAAGMLLPVTQVSAAATVRADGTRHFDSEPLAAVVARLARYHPVSFVFAEPQLQDLQVSGTFRVTDLKLFLRTLSAAFPIEARWVGPQRVEFAAREAGSQSRTDAGEEGGTQ